MDRLRGFNGLLWVLLHLPLLCGAMCVAVPVLLLRLGCQPERAPPTT